jgi:hypothetical protein
MAAPLPAGQPVAAARLPVAGSGRQPVLHRRRAGPHALHENGLPFINRGEHVNVPEIPALLSLPGLTEKREPRWAGSVLFGPGAQAKLVPEASQRLQRCDPGAARENCAVLQFGLKAQ